MLQHTPGPWIVGECNTPNGKAWFVNHLWKGPTDDSAGDCHTDEIAEVCMDYHGDTALENARLLAAAPAMQSSLMRILVKVQQGLDTADVRMIEAECKDALASAWGVIPKQVGTPDLQAIPWAEVDDDDYAAEALERADAQEAKLNQATGAQFYAHPDWYADGIEEGRDLWRMDLPDVQIQASIDVTNAEDEADGEPPVYGKDARLFIEHDVRGAGPHGDDRTKYSGDDFKSTRQELFALLLMSREQVAAKLTVEIQQVKAMPSDPRMCGGAA